MAGECGHHGNSIHGNGRLDPGQLAEGGIDVPKGARVFDDRAGTNRAGPIGKTGHTNPPLGHIAFLTGKHSIAIKKAA